MFVRSLLLGGTAALSASAMLVVPEFEPKMEAAEDGFINVHPMLLEDTRHAVVDLPCNECPFRQIDEDGSVKWTDGKPSSLMLDFAIEENRLLANGRQIFPPVPPSPVTAVQQLDDGELAGPMPVGYALEVMPVASPTDEPGAGLLDVRFTILDLETHPVPVNTVAVTLIQDPQGELYIAKTEIQKTALPSERLSWKKCQGKPKCLQKLMVARVNGLLAAAKERVARMASKTGLKGCGKNKTIMSADAGRPHHHMHASPPTHGVLALTFSRIVRFIVIPALLGVMAGLTASAIGMLVGQAIVFLWQRFRGSKPREHRAAWEEGDTCEKQGLITDYAEEELPEYTEEQSQRRGSMDKN